MNIMLLYIQFAVYVVISTEFNLGFIKESMVIMGPQIIPPDEVHMITTAVYQPLNLIVIQTVLRVCDCICTAFS